MTETAVNHSRKGQPEVSDSIFDGLATRLCRKHEALALSRANPLE